MIKVVFLDMDNTIAENTTCQNVKFVDGLYENKRPIAFVIDAVDILLRPNIEKMVLVTVFQGGDLGMQEKLFWLKKVNFKYDEILFIDENKTNKSTEMIKYCNDKGYAPKDCVLIDDKKKMLQEAEKFGFKVMYPQQLLVDYYEWLLNNHFDFKNKNIEYEGK